MLKMSTETGEDQKSSIPDIVRIFLVKKGVARAGIEPATQGFSVLCSTN